MTSTFPFVSLARLQEPVLSVYLDTNPACHMNRSSDHGHLSWFRSHSRQLLAHTEKFEQSLLGAELDRAEQLLERWPQEHRGLALFAGPETWEVIPMEIEPKNEIHWGRPMLWQLLTIAAHCPPSCIAIVDHSGARLFASSRGQIIPLELLEFRIDSSQWKKMQASHAAERGAGLPHGAQRDLFAHRREEQYLRFLAEAAQKITHACHTHSLSKVFLIGVARLTGPIERKLGPALRAHTTLIPKGLRQEIFSGGWQALEIRMQEFDLSGREPRVEELLNRSRGIVTGIEETLAELQRGRLASLAVTEDFDPLVRYCPRCDHASASSSVECPRCGGPQPVVTLHEILPLLLVTHRCEAEILSGRAAGRLGRAGSIGGWLRRRRFTEPLPLLARRAEAAHPVAGRRLAGEA